MEILLVLGILGILSAIVLVAINPSRQLDQAQGVNRSVSVREVENAIAQYIIDGNTMSGIPAGINNAQAICIHTVTGTDCTDAPNSGYDLSALTTDGEYLVALPVDPNETNPELTGYYIYQLGSFIKVCNPEIDPACGA